MTSKLKPPIAPMEARSVDEIPAKDRAGNMNRNGMAFAVSSSAMATRSTWQSKAKKPPGRYFPEVIKAIQQFAENTFVLDGEIAVLVGGKLKFDQLLQRIHPAASRIEKLSSERPAVLFIAIRRARRCARGSPSWPYPRENVAPCSTTSARRYFPRKGTPSALAGHKPADAGQEMVPEGWRQSRRSIVAKQLESPYSPGDVAAMKKIS